jgi:Na+/H+-dicarboxylate symporter
MENKKKKFKLDLTMSIYLALILGAVLGVLLKYVIPESYIRDTVIINGILYVVGQGFIKLMKMLVVPLVFCSIVCGAMAIGDTKKLGKVGIKTLLFYLATTALAITLALTVGSIISPGKGLNGNLMAQQASSSTNSDIDEVKTLISEKEEAINDCEDKIKAYTAEALDEENSAKLNEVIEEEESLKAELEEANANLAQLQEKADAESSKTKISETLLNIIPDNPVGALANGNMLPIIFFALFLGILLAGEGERTQDISNLFSQFNDIMMDMTMAVMKVAPVGVFCLIAKTFAGMGFEAFIPMIKYMLAVTLALVLQCFGVYQILFFVFTRLNPIKFIKKFFPVMSFAFSTATSNATIPLSIETLTEKLGVSKRIASFTIPLGATINMDGTSIMQGVAVIFVAQAFGITLSMNDYLTVIATATLASIGTAGVPSVGLVTLAMVFDSVGLPVEGIAIIMGIDRILDMIRTAVNITGDAVCTTIVANQDKAVDRELFNNMNV